MEILLLLGLIVLGLWVIRAFYRASASQNASRQPPPQASPHSLHPPRTRSGVQWDLSSPLPSKEEALEESRRFWIPPGSTVKVGDFLVPDGMVYLGSGMRALRGYAADPALIDPTLPLDAAHIDRLGAAMTYWPSYNRIPPGARAAYLEWHHRGRRDPTVYIGYVFLFFYGLERRLFFDSASLEEARQEVPLLLDEVRALLEVYGTNNSFRGYASTLLELVEITQGWIDPVAASPVNEGLGWEITPRTKYVLGQLVAKGRPIPAEWALAWWRQSSQSVARTPVRRCPEEFEALFIERYRQAFGEGLVIKPNRTPLSIACRPASSSFPGTVELRPNDVPDVTALTQPVSKLQGLADEICQELDSYSRWVGRHEDRQSPAAVALLPPELARQAVGEEAKSILEFTEQSLGESDSVVIESQELVSRWPSSASGKLTKKEAATLADFLGNFGFAIEPDVRFGGKNPTGLARLAVFRSSEASVPPGKEYAAASVLLRFGTVVVSADETVTSEEEEHLERHMEVALDLAPHARIRLRAHLRWLLSEPPSLAGMAQKIDRLDDEQRRGAARFLLSLAGADGHVNSSELKILSKAYKLLGLDPEAVYADVHTIAAGGGAGPITVIEGEAPAGIAIPVAPMGDDVALNRERIESIRQETREVGRMLEAVFVTEEDEEEPVVEVGTSAIEGLDPAHANLVQAVMAETSWSRERFDRLAEEHGLMPGGAIETINDFFFDLAGEPMLEGDDPLEVNAYAAEEVRK